MIFHSEAKRQHNSLQGLCITLKLLPDTVTGHNNISGMKAAYLKPLSIYKVRGRKRVWQNWVYLVRKDII